MSFKVILSPASTPKSWAALSVNKTPSSGKDKLFLLFTSVRLINVLKSELLFGTIICTFSSTFSFIAEIEDIYVSLSFSILSSFVNELIKSCFCFLSKSAFKLICKS